jgi:hypothetical protein
MLDPIQTPVQGELGPVPPGGQSRPLTTIVPSSRTRTLDTCRDIYKLKRGYQPRSNIGNDESGGLLADLQDFE